LANGGQCGDPQNDGGKSKKKIKKGKNKTTSRASGNKSEINNQRTLYG